MNLFEINQRIREIFDTIEQAEGELPEDLEQYLDQIETERGEKLKSLATVLHELRTEAKSIRATAAVVRGEYERIRDRATDKEAHADRLEQYLLRTTQHGEHYDWGHLKFRHTHSVVGNPKVEPELLPAKYQRVIVEAKLSELRADLKTDPTLERYFEVIDVPRIQLK